MNENITASSSFNVLKGEDSKIGFQLGVEKRRVGENLSMPSTF